MRLLQVNVERLRFNVRLLQVDVERLRSNVRHLQVNVERLRSYVRLLQVDVELVRVFFCPGCFIFLKIPVACSVWRTVFCKSCSLINE